MMLDTTQNEVLKYDDTSETHSHHLIPKLDNYYKSHSCHPDTFPRNTELRVGSLQLSVPQHSAQEALVLGGHKPLSPHNALFVMLPEILHILTTVLTLHQPVAILGLKSEGRLLLGQLLSSGAVLLQNLLQLTRAREYCH